MGLTNCVESKPPILQDRSYLAGIYKLGDACEDIALMAALFAGEKRRQHEDARIGRALE